MSRIKLEDNFIDVMTKMAEGNPGAMTVLSRLLQETEIVDPDSALGGLGPIFALDEAGIYGSNIWVLYKDICGESISKFIAVFRARQLGLIRRGLLNPFPFDGMDWEESRKLTAALREEVKDVVALVQTELPNFGKILTATI